MSGSLELRWRNVQHDRYTPPSQRSRAVNRSPQYLRAAGKPRFLYIFRCKQFCKIGITHDLKSRLLSYDGHNPFPVEMVASYAIEADTIALIERRAHVLLEPFFHHGEWFKCSKSAAIYAVEKATREQSGAR